MKLPKIVLTTIIIAAALSCGGCQFWENPPYRKEDLIYSLALLGKWGVESEEGEKKATIEFQREGRFHYSVVATVSGDKEDLWSLDGVYVFDGYLFKVGDATFLDLQLDLAKSRQRLPPEEKEKLALPKDAIQLKASYHLIWRVDIKRTMLTITFFDTNWLDDELEADPTLLAHKRINDDLFITASSAEIHAFLLQNLKTERAFTETRKMPRFKKLKAEE